MAAAMTVAAIAATAVVLAAGSKPREPLPGMLPKRFPVLPIPIIIVTSYRCAFRMHVNCGVPDCRRTMEGNARYVP
jgi:hypothetical protein